MQPVPVVVMGLGPIGQRILLAVETEPRLVVVGAVDREPALVGRPVSEVARGARSDVTVVASLAQVNAPPGAVVLQATGSWVPDVAPQLEDAADRGLHVVSTCEELVWPFDRHPELSRRLDDRARAAGVSFVATGVNPGFMMDALVVTLTAASHDIRSVRVERVIDPKLRRVQFQHKVGFGIGRDEYDARVASGRFGHVGLRESGQLAAVGLGWDIPDWTETMDPVQPDAGGPVLGLVQTLSGRTADGRRLDLRFEVHGGVSESFDRIVIDGTPPVRLRFEGGVFGDDATASAVVRAARTVRAAPPGLITVLDLPLRMR